MATQVITPTAEQEYLLNCVPQDDQPTFTTHIALATALHLVGLTKKGLRLDECGENVRRTECSNGHTTICSSYCGLSVCIECSIRDAEERSSLLEPLFPTLLATYSHLTWTELDLPCDSYSRDRVQFLTWEATCTFLSKLNDAGRSLAAFHAKLETGILLLTFIAGLPAANTLRIRFLALTSESEAPSFTDLKRAWPQASRCVVSSTHASELPKFTKFLFKPCIPKTPELCANMELALTRVRRLRTLGYLEAKAKLESKENSSETSVEESTLTLVSDDSDAPKVKKCKKCGAPIVKSEMIRRDQLLQPPKIPHFVN